MPIQVGDYVRIREKGQPYHLSTGTVQFRGRRNSMMAHIIRLDEPLRFPQSEKEFWEVTVTAKRLRKIKRPTGPEENDEQGH